MAVRYVPVAHAVGVDAPAAVHEPAGVAAHEEALVPPAVVLYVPAAHCVHDDAPAALQEPATHCSAFQHLVRHSKSAEEHGLRSDTEIEQYAPERSKKLPAGTSEHWDAPGCEYLPGVHKVGMSDGSAHAVPWEQTVHDDALVPPVAVRYVPAAHCVHVVAPAALHEPAAHSTGADDFDGHLYPAGHS